MEQADPALGVVQLHQMIRYGKAPHHADSHREATARPRAHSYGMAWLCCA
jgi:hypothetical protein